MKKQKFLRLGYKQYSKLGLRRKNKLKYRKAKGGENKVRLKMKGHLRNVNSGFRTEKSKRNLIKGLKPVMIFNIHDLKKIQKGEIGVLGRVGSRKKKEIAEYVKKDNIKLANLNPEKEIKKIEEKIQERKEIKKIRFERKIANDKKARKEAEKKAKEESRHEKSENKETSEKNTEIKTPEHNEKQNAKEIQTNNYGRGKWT